MNRKPGKTTIPPAAWPNTARPHGRELALEELDCAGFDLLLAEVLRRSDLPPAARVHLGECGGCAAKLDDFEAIADSVRQLSAAAAAPIPNQWDQIRAALLREGIIHADGQSCAQTPAPRLVRNK